MSITFQKRQKELKRQEKQRAKAERREQRKAVKRAEKDAQDPPYAFESFVASRSRSSISPLWPYFVKGTTAGPFR